MEFKITTFNLRLNHVDDKENAWPYRINSVVKFIKEEKPLIIGMQEVLDDMLSDLLKQLDNYSHIGMSRVENEEYNPIFYDHTILECREYNTFWLSETPNIPNSKSFNSACTRICTYGEFIFKMNRNKRLRIFNTHLDHISNIARIEGIKTIFNKIEEKQQEFPLPYILLGDFNSTKDDEVLIYLNNKKDLVNAYDYLPKNQYGATFHNFLGIIEGEPIDFIFASKGGIKILDTQIFREKIVNIYPSDHYPVTSIIKL